MTIKVAINGYGRIGRNVLRAHYEGGKKHDLAIVAINDLGSPETNAHLTRYDTAHGKFPGKIAVVNGLMTTVHAYTNDQVLTDVYHEDLRRARSATMSMIPTKTGAATAVGLVMPELNGKLDGYAIRVPTINVSIVDLSFVAARDTTGHEVNSIMKEASEGSLKGILGYNTAPLVSIDFNHNPASSTFDATLTKVSGRLVKA